jgi:hypothetical protein
MGRDRIAGRHVEADGEGAGLDLSCPLIPPSPGLRPCGPGAAGGQNPRPTFGRPVTPASRGTNLYSAGTTSRANRSNPARSYAASGK